MFPFSPRLWILVLGLAGSAVNAAVSLDGLATNSPFMLKQVETAAPVVTENASVEFRGMISTREGVMFGLYDRTRNMSAWVMQDDKDADFKVSSFDASADLVTVDYQGQKYTLPLSSAKITAAAPSPVMPVNPVVNAGQGARPAVARADDQRRLESVAAEVRRRRALRQAAAGTTPAAETSTTNARQ